MTERMTRTYLLISLTALVVAATTGSLLRFGLYTGMPAWASNFTAVRHAHSHLMYFGWATVGIMALIWHFLPGLTGHPLPRGVTWQMAATAAVALLSFPAFWINGYGLTRIGSVQLPLGSMVATLNIFTWFAFAGLYMRATRHLSERPLPIQLWDWALLLLLVASGGALGLGALVATGQTNHFLQQAFLHIFLDLFAVGWFTLASLGLLWAWIGQHTSLPAWLPSQSLATFLAPTFLLGISPTLVSAPLFWLAALANGAAAVLLGWHLFHLWQRREFLPPVIRFALMVLGVHLLTAAVVLWPGIWRWSAGTQLRIFFLHNLLLGWISSVLLGLVLAWLQPLPSKIRQTVSYIWMGSVGAMLLALLALGFIKFLPVPARFWLHLAAWSSVPLVGVAGFVLVGALLQKTLPGRTATADLLLLDQVR